MDVNVRGQRVVLTRGDAHAAAFAASLLDEGASVTVISPTVGATIEDWSHRRLLTWSTLR